MSILRLGTWNGKPIIVLGAIFFFWITGRFVLWESPFLNPEIIAELPPLFAENSAGMAGERRLLKELPQLEQEQGRQDVGAAAWPTLALGAAQEKLSGGDHLQATPLIAANLQSPVRIAQWSTHKPAIMFASHQMLWMAGMARIAPPPELLTLLEQSNRQNAPAFSDTKVAASDSGSSKGGTSSSVNITTSAKRVALNNWSLDSWIFLRQSPGNTDNFLASAGARAPSYGASQVGAVLNYRLVPASPHAPRAYARVSAALENSSDREVAAGLSARPNGKIPLRTQVELRTRLKGGKAQVRPAAFVVSEVPPIRLSASTRLEGYFQAGYVGGRDATPFADGQLRIDRKIVDIDRARLRIGGGAWAGAQKGANRVDIGPSARLELQLGKQPARFDLDYRHQVSGSAEPRSGVALTVSTGF